MNARVVIPLILAFTLITVSVSISFSENNIGGSASLVYKRGDKNAIITPEVYYNGYIKYQPYLILVIPCKLDNNLSIKSIERFNGEILYYDKNGNIIEQHTISSSSNVRIDNGGITDQLVNWLNLAPDKPVYVKKAFDSNKKYFNGTTWLWSNISYLAVTLNLSDPMFQHILNNSDLSKIVINFSIPNYIEVKDEKDNTKYCKPVSVTLYVIDAPLNSVYTQSLIGEDKGNYIELDGVFPRIKFVELNTSKIKKLLVLDVIYKANVSIYNITKTGARLEDNKIEFFEQPYATVGFSIIKFGSKVYLAYAPMINNYTDQEKSTTLDIIKKSLESNYAYYTFSRIRLMRGSENYEGLKSVTLFVECSDKNLSGIYTLNEEELENINEYVCNASNKKNIFPETQMYSITYVIPIGKDDDTKNVKYLYNKILVVNASKFNIDFFNKNIYKVVFLAYTNKPENIKIKIEKPCYSLVDLLDYDEYDIPTSTYTLSSSGLVEYFNLLDSFDPTGNFSSEVKGLVAKFRDEYGLYVYGKVVNIKPEVEQYGNVVIIKLRFNISKYGHNPAILYILFTVLDNTNQQAINDSIKFTATNFALDVYHNANMIDEEGSPETIVGYRVTFQPYPTSPSGEKMYVLSFIPTVTIRQQPLPTLPPIFPIFKIAEKAFYFGFKLWWATYTFITKSLHGFKFLVAPWVFYKPIVRHIAIPQLHATAEYYISKVLGNEEKAKKIMQLFDWFENWNGIFTDPVVEPLIKFQIKFSMMTDPYSMDYFIIGIKRISSIKVDGKIIITTNIWLNPDSAFGQLKSYYEMAKEGLETTYAKFEKIQKKLDKIWNIKIKIGNSEKSLSSLAGCDSVKSCSPEKIINAIRDHADELSKNGEIKRVLQDLRFLDVEGNYNPDNILEKLAVDPETRMSKLIPDINSKSLKEIVSILKQNVEKFENGETEIFQVRKYGCLHDPRGVQIVGDVEDEDIFKDLVRAWYENYQPSDFPNFDVFYETIQNRLNEIRTVVKEFIGVSVEDLFNEIVEKLNNGETFSRSDVLEKLVNNIKEKDKITLDEILYGEAKVENGEIKFSGNGLLSKIRELQIKVNELKKCLEYGADNPYCELSEEGIENLKNEIRKLQDEIESDLKRIKKVYDELVDSEDFKKLEELKEKKAEVFVELIKKIHKKIEEDIILNFEEIKKLELDGELSKVFENLKAIKNEIRSLKNAIEEIEALTNAPRLYFWSKFTMGLKAISNKVLYFLKLSNIEELEKEIEKIGSKIEKVKLWFKEILNFRPTKIRNFFAKISELANEEVRLFGRLIKVGKIIGGLGTTILGGASAIFDYLSITRPLLKKYEQFAEALAESSYTKGASIAVPIIMGFYSHSSIGIPVFINFNDIPTMRFPKVNVVDLLNRKWSIPCISFTMPIPFTIPIPYVLSFPAKAIYLYSYNLGDYPINQYNPPMTSVFDFYTGDTPEDFNNWVNQIIAWASPILSGADTFVSLLAIAGFETEGLSLIALFAYLVVNQFAACNSIMHIPIHERLTLFGYNTFGIPFKRIEAKLEIDPELMSRASEELKGVSNISNDIHLSILLNASVIQKMLKDICVYAYFGKYNESDGNCYAGELFKGTKFEDYAKAIEPYYGPINLSVLLDTGYIYGGMLYIPYSYKNFTPKKYIDFLNSIYNHIKSNWICSAFNTWYSSKVWEYINTSLGLSAAALYVAMNDKPNNELQAKLMTAICMEAVTYIDPTNPAPISYPIREICQMYISLCYPSVNKTFQELLMEKQKGYSPFISFEKLPPIITTEDEKMEFLTDNIWVGTYNDSGKLKYLIKAPLIFHIAKLDKNYLINTINFKIINQGDVCKVEKEIKIPIYGMQIRFGIDVVGYDPLNNTYHSMVAENLQFINNSFLITVPISGKNYYFIKADIVNLTELSKLPPSRMTLIYNAPPNNPTPRLMVYVYNNTRDKTVNYIRIFYSDKYTYNDIVENALLDYDNYSHRFVARPNFIKVINNKSQINRIYNFIKNGISDINSIGYTLKFDEDDPWVYAKDVANILKQLFNNKGYLDVFYLLYKETDKGLVSNVIAIPNESTGTVDIFATKGFIGYNNKDYLNRFEYMKPEDVKDAAFYWLYPKKESCLLKTRIVKLWCRVLHVERTVDWANKGYVFQGYFEVSLKVDKKLIDKLMMKCSRKYKNCKILIVAKPEKSRFITSN